MTEADAFTPCPEIYWGEDCELPAGHADEHESRSYIWPDSLKEPEQPR